MSIKLLSVFRLHTDAPNEARYKGQRLAVKDEHQRFIERCRQSLLEGTGRGTAVVREGEGLQQDVSPALANSAQFDLWVDKFCCAFEAWFSQAEVATVPPPPLLAFCVGLHRGVESLLIVLTEENSEFLVTSEFEVLDVRAVAVDRGIRVVDIVLQDGDELGPRVRFAGRLGRKVGDPLFDVLGLVRDDAPVAHGTQLAETVSAFCQSQGLDVKEQMSVKQGVARLCRERFAEGEPIKRQEIAETIEEMTGVVTVEALLEQQGLDQHAFMAAPIGFTKGSRFAGAGRGMSISFDRALLGHSVQFDAATGNLVFSSLPANLLDQLRKACGFHGDMVAQTAQSD